MSEASWQAEALANIRHVVVALSYAHRVLLREIGTEGYANCVERMHMRAANKMSARSWERKFLHKEVSDRILKALTLLREGKTQAETAKALGVSRQCVRNWIRRSADYGCAEAKALLEKSRNKKKK